MGTLSAPTRVSIIDIDSGVRRAYNVGEGAEIRMATVNINFRVDEELKKQATELLSQMGMDMSTMLNVFLKTLVREKSVPFRVTALSRQDEYILAGLRQAEGEFANPESTLSSHQEVWQRLEETWG